MSNNFIIFVTLFTIFALVYSSTFIIDANSDQCFYDELKMGESVIFMYQVISGGSLDIDLTVCEKRFFF